MHGHKQLAYYVIFKLLLYQWQTVNFYPLIDWHFELVQIETIFKGKACNEIKESASGLTKRLAQTAKDTFGDFEEAVEKDATKTAVLDGTVHPLTSYVINYVKFLFE